MAKAKKKNPGGRPKLKASERQRAATTSLPPHLYRVAESIGGGSVYRGLRLAVERVAAMGEEKA